MSTFTKFAIVGAGGVGSGVAEYLLQAKATVTILTRDDTKVELQAFKERGVSLVKVNYDNEASLKAALTGNEVVVCTIHAYHHSIQFAVARAAKAAGLQLFVPTEFGMADEDGPNVTKEKVRTQLKELELPFALFHALFIPRFAYHLLYIIIYFIFLFSFLGYNFKEGAMTVVGDGDAKMSIVARSDLCRFIAHVLVTAAKCSLEWSRFSVESDRMSPKEIAALAEKKLGKKMELKLVSYDETKKKYETDPVAYILTRVADGRCVSGTVDEAKDTVAKYYPGWNPTPYEMFIA
ncbi:Serine/threonine-protein phosphatase 2A activator [Phytophthora nicotianae]|uniref:Serine/threonine-protein phosphatase 2A activator n=1 Tax=Phytophthora nicotianae TaxID=4792 RepID=A0A0W8DBV0_PHYNI|nr:Serine/threonine-protein phosphatase 2A activator [Phytophthora nicotianae]